MNWIESLFTKGQADYKFIYPYSPNPVIKRVELTQNLENGVLFEDLSLFIRWKEPFSNLQRFVQKKQKNKLYRDSGQHVVIDGLLVSLNPHETITNSTPFIQINSFLGFDDDGHQRYVEFKNHIIQRFGEPSTSENSLPYDFYGDTSLYWIGNKFQIVLSVWERFAVHYSFKVEAL